MPEINGIQRNQVYAFGSSEEFYMDAAELCTHAIREVIPNSYDAWKGHILLGRIQQLKNAWMDYTRQILTY